MYYVFSSTLHALNNLIIQAKLETSLPQITPHWWEAMALNTPLPLMTFTVKQESSLPDNLFTGTVFDLYSKRLTKVLRNLGINFETFPVVIVGPSGEELKVNYNIFHLLEKHPCLDLERSEIDDEALEVRKLMLNEKILLSEKLMFRIEELSQIVLVHHKLKNELDAKKITGCSYIPINEYQSGLRFYFNQYKKDDPI